MKLTDSVVRSATLPAGRNDMFIWDGAVTGFGLRVRATAKGVAKTFIVQYRDDLGLTRRYILGTTAELNTVKARELAADKMHAVRHGTMPHLERAQREQAAERQRDLARETFGSIAELFLTYQRKKVSPRWMVEVERHVTKAWAPLAHVSIHAIDQPMVARRLNEITAQSGETAANHARSTLSKFYVWVQEEGLFKGQNPTTRTRKHETASRDRVLTDIELTAIWKATDDGCDFSRIVRLLMLTGARRTEVGGMRWSEIVEDLWTLPAARSKNGDEHHVPLASLALTQLPPPRTGDYLFGDTGGFANWARGKVLLDARILVAGWTLHDLRRSCATHLAKLGQPPHIIEEILNHRRKGVAGIYNRHTYDAEVKQALAMWADHVEAIVSGRDRKVVPLHRAG